MRAVLKIGGSNLKSSDDLLHILQALQLYKKTPIIVLSAVYGVTDELIALMKTVLEADESIETQLKPIIEKYLRMLTPFFPSAEERAELLKLFDQRCDALRRYLLGIQCFHQVPDFAYHFVVSYGERLSVLMLALFLEKQGMACKELFPEDCGFVTHGNFPSREIDFAQSRSSLQSAVEEDVIYLFPGFYAISEDHKVTLLGRGGTDYSAASIAYCIGAPMLDIWKDVDGFLSADPKYVSNSHLISDLSYNEAAELSYFGAKILHPRTMHPVKLGKIPTRILNIRKLSKEAGSVILPESQVVEHGVKSVSHSLNFGILRISGPDVGMEAGIISEVSSLFSQHDLNIKSIITSQTAINFLFEKDDLTQAYELVNRLDHEVMEELALIQDITVLALVGEGFREHPGILAKALNALSSKAINVEMLVAGASPVSSYIIVKEQHLLTALQAIHDEFFPALSR